MVADCACCLSFSSRDRGFSAAGWGAAAAAGGGGAAAAAGAGAAICSSVPPPDIRTISPPTGVAISTNSDLWLPTGLCAEVATSNTRSFVSLVNLSSGAVVCGGRPSSRATPSPSNGRACANVQTTWAGFPCSQALRASVAVANGSTTSIDAICDATQAAPPASACAST